MQENYIEIKLIGQKKKTYNNGDTYEGFLVNGKRAPIIGKICMDSFMIDVTDIEGIHVGDEVIIWDNENITIEQLAEKCNTINYEFLSTISERVPRMFI